MPSLRSKAQMVSKEFSGNIRVFAFQRNICIFVYTAYFSYLVIISPTRHLAECYTAECVDIVIASFLNHLHKDSGPY